MPLLAGLLWQLLGVVVCLPQVSGLRARYKSGLKIFEHGQAHQPIPQPAYGRYTGNWQDHFDSYMADVQHTNNPAGLSIQCTPYIHRPSKSPGKGLQILLHGFTACPGQWYLLAPSLVEQGWSVMAPLMPGHGREPLVIMNATNAKGFEVEYWNEELPIQKTTYSNFTQEILNIAMKYKVENPDMPIVLTGLSLGGTVATQLLMDAPQVWDRVMLMNPFLAFPTSLLTDFGFSMTRTLIPMLLPLFGTFFFGHSCDLRWAEGSGGTGGVCQGKMKNLQKVMEFSNVVNSELRTRAAQLGVHTGGLFDRLGNYIHALLTDEPGPLGYKLPEKNVTRCCCKKVTNELEEPTCKLMLHHELRETWQPWKWGTLVCPSERGFHRFDRKEVGLGELPNTCKEAEELLEKRRMQIIRGMVPQVKVQVLGTYADPGVANSQIQFLSDALELQLGETDQFGFCVWPQDFDHVYIAPVDYEAEERDAWWLNASRVVGNKTATDLILGFLSSGDYVPTHATDVAGGWWFKGSKMCDIEPVVDNHA